MMQSKFKGMEERKIKNEVSANCYYHIIVSLMALVRSNALSHFALLLLPLYATHVVPNL